MLLAVTLVTVPVNLFMRSLLVGMLFSLIDTMSPEEKFWVLRGFVARDDWRTMIVRP